MSIDANLVKTLREKTGAGMMDCKKALQESEGNIEDAVDYLRKLCVLLKFSTDTVTKPSRVLQPP